MTDVVLTNVSGFFFVVFFILGSWFSFVNMFAAHLFTPLYTQSTFEANWNTLRNFPRATVISSNHSDFSQQKINLIFCQSSCQLLKTWSLSFFNFHFSHPSLSHSLFRPCLIKIERKWFAVSNSGKLIGELNYRAQWITYRTFSTSGREKGIIN